MAERLAELDAREKPPPPPPPPRPSSRYSWVVGIAFLLAIIVAGVNSLPHGGRSLRGPARGDVLLDFAAPAATGGSDRVANVRQRTDGSERQGRRPACDVKGPGVVNVCELRRRPLVLTLIVTRGADCEPQLDRVERVRSEFPNVAFAAVVSGESLESVRRLVDSRGWDFPVAVDRDGAVVNLYGVGVCPTTTFAAAGGRVRETKLGSLSDGELRAAVRRLR